MAVKAMSPSCREETRASSGRGVMVAELKKVRRAVRKQIRCEHGPRSTLHLEAEMRGAGVVENPHTGQKGRYHASCLDH